MSIVLLSIYLLTLVSLVIMLVTLTIKVRDKVKSYQYQKRYNEIYPYVEAYIKDENSYSRRIHHVENKLEKKVILDILLDYSKRNHISIAEKFDRLGYIDGLIQSAQKGLTLELVRALGLIKSHKAFPVFMKGINTPDYELKYHCYYALSLLDLNGEQVKTYKNALLSSEIMRDRVIEMINNLSLSPSTYIDLLEEEEMEQGKVVFLRVLENKLNVQDEKKSDTLVRFLSDSKEVRIAAVVTLISTKNKKYFNPLVTLYEKEEAWEVRAAIAKSIDMLSHPEDILVLKKMVYDSNWWVRFNAAEVLARKGLAGIDALIDISLSSKDDAVSNLAYYILNANHSVNKSIIEFKEEYSDLCY